MFNYVVFMRKIEANIIRILFVCLFSVSSINLAQNRCEIFPSELLIQPFTANSLKPRLGFDFKTNKNELSLDVGHSMDILHVSDA